MGKVVTQTDLVHPNSSAGYLPDTNRVSVLAAMVVLAYTLSNYIILPERGIFAQLPGFYLDIPINIDTVTAILVAGLMATGADWLLRDHPALQNKISAFPHWVLPALTALVIGMPLNQIDYGLSWWGGLFLGAGIVVLVLIGEYISIDPQDLRQPLASAGLSAVAYIMLLVLISVLRSEGLRLFFVIPAITIAVWLVCMRVMHLRLHGEWTIYEAAIIDIIVGQVAAAFHYWPLSPVSYGIALLGLSLCLINVICGLIEEKPFRTIVWESVISVGLSWAIAFWIL